MYAEQIFPRAISTIQIQRSHRLHYHHRQILVSLTLGWNVVDISLSENEHTGFHPF